MRHWIWIIALLLSAGTAQAQSAKTLLRFRGSASPEAVGRRVTDRFLASDHFNYGHSGRPKAITYPEVCVWYGALRFAEVSHDRGRLRQLRERFEPLLGVDSSLLPEPVHVDYTVFGAVPLELAMQTGQRPYLELGRRMADAQWTLPSGSRATPEARALAARGLTWQTRMWIDDMFMITAVQAQAYRATGNPVYIDRAAKEMVVYLDSLQRPNGLFYHAPDVPFYWGRGNGWMAAGMTELLRSLPEDNPDRARIMQGYRRMMQALLQYQSPQGMWRQLVDDPAAWPETSGTGMFTYAMITGVKAGWLDAKMYGPAARKAWLALISYLDDHADMREVCEGTNKKNDRQYYLDRKRVTGDLHGQAPVLWCAAALLRR